MTFEEMKKIVVDTLNCEEDKVTMEASLTEDLEADSLDAVELNMALEDAWSREMDIRFLCQPTRTVGHAERGASKWSRWAALCEDSLRSFTKAS